jgi:hypothetical protein
MSGSVATDPVSAPMRRGRSSPAVKQENGPRPRNLGVGESGGEPVQGGKVLFIRTTVVLMLIAAAVAGSASCGGSDSAPNSSISASLSDDQGDVSTEYPQLDLLGMELTTEGGTANFAITTAGPTDAPIQDPQVTLSWSILVQDRRLARVILVTRTIDEVSASLQFAGPSNADFVELSAPTFEGNRVLVSVPMSTFKWSGRDAEWDVTSAVRRGDADPERVDEIPKRPIEP